MRRFAGVLTILGVLATGVLVASPAQAYGNLDVFYAEFNPNTCTVLEGTLQIAYDGRCRVDYVVDDRVLRSWFQPDVNSRAVAVRIWSGSQLVGFVEFHPYDEILYVVDTENDGDAIYVELLVNAEDPHEAELLGPFTPVGTSEVVDVGRFNRNFPDGQSVQISIYDDAAGNDLIWGGLLGVA